jgi:hypothetical protein
MASTVTIESNGRSYQFPSKVRRGTMTLGTYATNGVVVAGSQFELYGRLDDLRVDPAGGYVPRWDKTNGKVLVYRQKDPAAAGGADIALPEVANGVDLSSISFRFRAEGR